MIYGVQNMESLELGRKLKRNCENLVSKKRVALGLVLGFVTVVYIIPYLLRWKRSPAFQVDVIDDCLRDRLTSFVPESAEYNVQIRHFPPAEDENDYISYVGNGNFGLDVLNNDQIYIKSGRHLSLRTGLKPVYIFQNNNGKFRSAYVTDFQTGIVHGYQCYDSGFYASFQYYAHRRQTGLFVQDIKLSNPTDRNIEVSFLLPQLSSLRNSATRLVEIQDGETKSKYNVTSGYIRTNSQLHGDAIPMSIVYKTLPTKMKVDARSSKQMIQYTSISYSSPKKAEDLTNKNVYSSLEKTGIDEITAASADQAQSKSSHARAWQQLWTTGFTIETSKAKDALNGDKINATMYYVISQVKDGNDISEVASRLSYAEGCYGNHHTLEATNLWGNLDSVTEVNKLVSYWLLTLEKNGCDNMLKAGARGVVEAMVLSFGGLRFSKQHLEFNIDPKYLHRDCLYHRIAYGNRTHVNISVAVQEDNKAVLRVALDRSDKNYYACDAGCLDTPVLLGPQLVTFPVKLTEPLTPILYITYDKQHMEELQQAIHVREIAEAPPHEHHVIALHKHGHHLGGLPTFFWVSVFILILIFHLFLFKLIYNEYCSGNTYDRPRFRYGKL